VLLMFVTGLTMQNIVHVLPVAYFFKCEKFKLVLPYFRLMFCVVMHKIVVLQNLLFPTKV